MIDWLLSLSTIQVVVFSLVLILAVFMLMLAANDPRRRR